MDFCYFGVIGIVVETFVTRYYWRRSKTYFGDGVLGMIGIVLFLLARIIGFVFIINKGAFWSFCYGVFR